VQALILEFRDRKRTSGAGVLILLAAALGMTALGVLYERIAAETAHVQAEVRALGAVARKHRAVTLSATDVQQRAVQVKHAREVLLQLGTPWNQLFSSVEGIGAPDVAVLEIASDADKRRVKISAEARNLDAMVDFLRKLARRPTLADVFLQSHQVQLRDPQHPVRFVVTAAWMPDK
jgi:hypothetical protein